MTDRARILRLACPCVKSQYCTHRRPRDSGCTSGNPPISKRQPRIGPRVSPAISADPPRSSGGRSEQQPSKPIHRSPRMVLGAALRCRIPDRPGVLTLPSIGAHVLNGARGGPALLARARRWLVASQTTTGRYPAEPPRGALPGVRPRGLSFERSSMPPPPLDRRVWYGSKV
jgi:hypothetical protein